jgi:hypothetical protein
MESSFSNEVKLIRGQIEKLFEKEFDLEAWKTLTIVVIERIFGQDSSRIKQIKDLKYDYSSWALRDASGIENNMDTCKKAGMEILEAAIFELENFGSPTTSDVSDEKLLKVDKVIEALEDELKGSEYKILKEIVSSEDTPEDKRSRLVGKLKEFGYDVSPEILAKILLFPEVSGEL